MSSGELTEYSAGSLAAAHPAALLALLVRDEDRAPRALIDECARRDNAMVDHLESFVMNDSAWNDDASLGEWWLRYHAAMILGLMSSERAAQLLVALMRNIAVAEDDDLQDWLISFWPALFRNKPDGALPALRALAEDRALDWYYRCGAVDVAVALAEARAAQSLEDELDWAAGLAELEDEDWDARIIVGTTLLDYPRERHRGLLERLAASQSPQDLMFGADDIQRAFASPGAMRNGDRGRDPWGFYAPEAIAERQRRWTEEDDVAARRADGTDARVFDDRAGLEPVRVAPKIGRNERCPCGSGRKYKRCCLAKDAAARRFSEGTFSSSP